MSAFSLAQARRSPGAMCGINTTPLVDVMLVLLIIFMIAAPLLTQRIDFELPAKAREQLQEPGPRLQIQLLKRPDGNIGYWLDGLEVDRTELARRLRKAAAGQPQTAFTLQADARIRYEVASQTMALIYRSGLRKGSFELAP